MDSRRTTEDMLGWITAIERLSIAVNEQQPLPEFLALIASTACDLLGYESSGVLLASEDSDTLRIEGSSGLAEDYLAHVNVEAPLSLSRSGQYAGSPSRRAYIERRPILVDDIEADPTYGPWTRAARMAGHRSMAAVPLYTRSDVVGTLNVYGTRPRQLDALGVQLLQVLASHAGIALETSTLIARDRARLEELRDLNQSLSHQQSLLMANARIHESLMAIVERGGGVGETASALAEMTHSPVAVTDLTGRVLASAPYGGLALDVSGSDAEGAVATSVQVGGERLGAVWSTSSALKDELATRAIEQGAVIVGQELLRRRASDDARWQLRGDLLSEILSGAVTDLDRIRARGHRIGVDLTLPHHIAAFRAADGEGSAVRLHRALRPPLEAAGHPRSLLAHRDGTALVTLPAGAGQEDAVSVAARLRAGAAANLDIDVRVAISAAVTVVQFPAAMRQVFGLLRLVPSAVGEAVLTVANTGLVGFVLADLDPASTSLLVERWVEPLRQHDAQHGTSLLATARSYTDHNQNTATTARALFVHPNTVNQRLKRIETTLRAELTNLDHLTALRTALLVDDVIQHRDR